MISGPLGSYALSNRNHNRIFLHSLIKDTIEYLLITGGEPPLLLPERVFLTSQGGYTNFFLCMKYDTFDREIIEIFEERDI